MSNHFELFGLPASFELDPKQLDARYRELSQQWHPDKFAGGSPKERIQALEMTSRINDGYKVLRDPALRAAYLLKLLGLDVDDESERTHQMEPAFLMEILELREQLDELNQQNDVEGALRMGAQMAEREKQTHAVLSQLFAEQQRDPAPARLKKLGDQVAALRYFRRFQDEVSAIEEASLS